MTDRVFRDLNENGVAGLQGEFDATGLVAGVCGIPVDLARVQHRVTPAADVDERRLHARQHVLHTTEVHVADERGFGGLRHVVLDQNAVFEHADLNAVVARPNDHGAVDRLAAGQELGLGDDRAAAAGVAAVTATLLLRLEARRTFDPLRLGDQFRGRRLARCAHLDHRVRRQVVGAGGSRRRCGGECGDGCSCRGCPDRHSRSSLS